MKYGLFWDADREMASREDRPDMDKLPRKCCGKCDAWLQHTKAPCIGTCIENELPDYDMFSWADDLCGKFDAKPRKVRVPSWKR